jgi:HSP20 family protein
MYGSRRSGLVIEQAPLLPKYVRRRRPQDRRLLELVRLQEEARMPATLAYSELLLPFAAASDLGGWSAPVDVREHPARYTVVADLPGVEPSTLEVSAHGDVLTITGTRRDRVHAGGVPVRLERPTGKLRRSLQLPGGCDGNKIRTRLREGVLEIDVPKCSTNRPGGHEHEGGDHANRAHDPRGAALVVD